MKASSIQQQLRKAIPIEPLIFFRIGFGVTMFIEMMRFFAKGWIERYYIRPQFYFTYDFFHWLSPWPGDGMYVHFTMLAILAVFIAVGFLYRTSALLFFLGFTYVFLLDKTNYLNHFYLISLLSFILIWLPAHRMYSVDALLKPRIKSPWQPAWSLWWLRAQIGLAYFFGGVAKINGDWLRGEPMRMWLAKRDDFPVIGQLFHEEWMVYFMAYSGLLLDLLIVPALLWSRTRKVAYLLILTFHLMNSQLFVIGIFPWFMIVGTLIFFPPEWFRLRKPGKRKKKPTFTLSPLLTYGLTLYLAIQVLLPLRHWLYPGNVNWTEEGHRFAWHMKLRSKSTDTRFYVVTPTDSARVNLKAFLTTRQINKIEDKPDMIWQFAQYLDDQINEGDVDSAKVYVVAKCGLNGRKRQLLINPSVDMTEATWSPFTRSAWIMPLTIPLSSRRE